METQRNMVGSQGEGLTSTTKASALSPPSIVVSVMLFSGPGLRVLRMETKRNMVGSQWRGGGRD